MVLCSCRLGWRINNSVAGSDKPCSPCPCNLTWDSSTCFLTSAHIKDTPQLLFANRKPFNSVKSAGNEDRYRLVYWRREMDSEALTDPTKVSLVRLGSKESIPRFSHYKICDFRYWQYPPFTGHIVAYTRLFRSFNSRIKNDRNTDYSEAVHNSNTYIRHAVVNQHANSVYVSFFQKK
jgi:hypothetical protein